MIHLLNLLASIALLVWGTQIVRTGILRVFGENLRHVLAQSMGSRSKALLAGLGVTSLIQSGTATCLIVSSFLGRNLVPLSAGLAVMLGADMGTSLMAVVFSFDLSWLSPLLIFLGVVLFITRDKTTAGHLGRVAIGLGLILLSLQLIILHTRPLIEAPAVRGLLAALPNEVLLDIVVGALLTVLSYSSLAIVLLTATLAGSGMVPTTVALGLVLGANIGSGVLAVLSTVNSPVAARRLPIGNLVFKLAGCLLMLPLLGPVHVELQQWLPAVPQQVVVFHLAFNILLAVTFIGLTGALARVLERSIKAPKAMGTERPEHLDLSALATPSLAISCAAREALHQADVVETMLRGILPVMRHNDLELAERLRKRDDEVDRLYTAIKLYLTQVSREALSEREGRRWADVMSFTINMEQIGDIIERVLQDLEDKKIRPNRRFSDAGMAEICHLHERLTSNLRLAMSVFLDGHLRDARRLLEEKTRFGELEREYAATHIARLQDNTTQSIETSSLHLDLISDLKRINSHICSVAYPILDSVGALVKTRTRNSVLVALEADEKSRR
jgi:phosphate:Na+ symporter